jgi:valyl-tRNA synthetase
LLKLRHPLLPHGTEQIWSNLPDRDARLIVSPWPEADASFEADSRALERVQDSAAIYRRSRIRVALPDPDAERIFRAVVRPSEKDGADPEPERERLRKEIARAEGMLANERFVSNAAADVVEGEREKLARYRRELDALGG